MKFKKHYARVAAAKACIIGMEAWPSAGAHHIPGKRGKLEAKLVGADKLCHLYMNYAGNDPDRSLMPAA